MFLAAYYWGFSFIEVQGPHKRCKGRWCVQGPHLLPIYLYILRIINMIWCKGLNERCKGLNEWCKGHNEWCKGLWCVQGPHNMPFYLITNDNQYGGSIHCSLAPCYLWESAKRQWIYFHTWRYWENLQRNRFDTYCPINIVSWSFFGTKKYTKDNFCFHAPIFHRQIKLIALLFSK